MKAVIQRVSHASVTVNDKRIAEIGSGFLILLGVTHDDVEGQAAWLASKVINLRVFEDEQGKMNQSIFERQGEILVVSQFTLYADCSAGRRPSFIKAAKPDHAEELYKKFIEELQKSGLKVQTGEFGAEMKVSLLNDGPVTLIIES